MDRKKILRNLEKKDKKEYNLQQYFSAEEWADLCDFEKICYKNIIINYELMLECGLKVGKPEFMQKDWQKKYEQAEELKVESDEEWTPAGAREKERDENRKNRKRAAVMKAGRTQGGNTKKKQKTSQRAAQSST